MKLVAGIIIGAAVTLFIALLFLTKNAPVALPVPTPVVSISPSPVVSTTPNPEVMLRSSMGTISGKLCYPSSFLPKGKIEAKNTLSNLISSKDFPGTEGGGVSEFTMDVPPGIYILRYKAQPDPNSDALYGYYTDVCPTGVETTCAAINERNNKQVVVSSGEKAENINLCDFYYDASTDPGF